MCDKKLERLKALAERLEKYKDDEKEFYPVLKLLEEEYAAEGGIEGEGEYNENLANVLKKQANRYLQYVTAGEETRSNYYYQEFVNHFKMFVRDEIFRIRAL